MQDPPKYTSAQALEEVRSLVLGLGTEVTGLGTEVTGLRTEVTGLRSDLQSGLKEQTNLFIVLLFVLVAASTGAYVTTTEDRSWWRSRRYRRVGATGGRRACACPSGRVLVAHKQ